MEGYKYNPKTGEIDRIVLFYSIPVYRNEILYVKYESFRYFDTVQEVKEFIKNNKLSDICRFDYISESDFKELYENKVLKIDTRSMR